MRGGERIWRLRVLTGGDTLRQERLTRDLRDELQKCDGVGVTFTEDGTVDDDGRKGGIAGDVALLATIASVGRPTSRVLMTLIKEWCTKERHRKVELTHGDDSITITGRPDASQERIIREFLTKVCEEKESDEGKEAE